jgi:hypothetical protein
VRPWHVRNDKLSSSAISLIVKRRFPRITALTQSTVSLVRAVDGRPVCGSSSMDVRPFLNREYHSHVLDRLNAVSPNACCSISYLFCGRLTKFLAELDANTLLLQHIHFTIRRRDKHDCTVDQLTHDWVKLPSAPLVCGVRRCCQVSYMVVTSILSVVSI